MVRKVESFRVGRRSNSNALTRTYTVASDDLSGERRVQARLTGIRLGSGSKPNDVARLSGETEVFLIDALRSVPVLVTYDEQGRIQGIDGWEHTQRAALDAVAGRIASLQSGAVALHGDARLAANAVAAIDAEVAGGLVRASRTPGRGNSCMPSTTSSPFCFSWRGGASPWVKVSSIRSRPAIRRTESSRS